MAGEGLNIPITGDASGLVAAFQSASSALRQWQASTTSAYDGVNRKAQEALVAVVFGHANAEKAVNSYKFAIAQQKVAEAQYWTDVVAMGKRSRAELAAVAQQRIEDQRRMAAEVSKQYIQVAKIALETARQEADAAKIAVQRERFDLSAKVADVQATHKAAMAAISAETAALNDQLKVSQALKNLSTGGKFGQTPFPQTAGGSYPYLLSNNPFLAATTQKQSAAMGPGGAIGELGGSGKEYLSYLDSFKQVAEAGKKFRAEMAAMEQQRVEDVKRMQAQIQEAYRQSAKVTNDAAAAAAQQRANNAMDIGKTVVANYQKGMAAALATQKQATVANEETSRSLLSLIPKYIKAAAAATGLYKMWQMGAQLVSKLMRDYNSLGDSIMGLKLVTGDTTERTSEFLYVANMMNVSSLSLQMRIAQMSKHLVDNSKWIKAMGIEYKNADGSVKATSDTFYEIADAISKVTDQEKREAIALNTFGRGYKDILPVLALTKKQRDELIKQGRAGGAIWSDEDLKKQRQFALSQRQMMSALQQLGATIMRAVAPHLMGFFNMLRELANWLRNIATTSPRVANAMKLIGLALVTIWNPLVGVITLLAYLVQRFEPVGEAIIMVAEIVGNVAGKVLGGIALVVQGIADIILGFVDAIIAGLGGLAKVLKVLSFGHADYVDEIDSWRRGIKTAKTAINDTVGAFGNWAWDKGGEIGKKFGEGFVALLKKLKIKPSDIGLGFGEGAGFDPTTAGGGGGKGKKSKLLEYFDQLVAQSREVLKTLRDKAVEAKKEMQDFADKTSKDFAKVLSLETITKEMGGYVGPKRLIGMFQKRLADMKSYVANIKTLRSMGLPAEMIADLVNMGVADGARMAKMLIGNPSAIPQLADLQAQITLASQEAGAISSEAVYGQRVQNAIAAAVGAQGKFNTLLGEGGRFGYKPSQEDLQLASTNISNQVMMSVQSNADPAVIERAIAWALRTGVPPSVLFAGGIRPGSSGFGMLPSQYGQLWPNANFSMMQSNPYKDTVSTGGFGRISTSDLDKLWNQIGGTPVSEADKGQIAGSDSGSRMGVTH